MIFFCHLCLFSSGLNILYQGDAELNKLLKLVLTEGNQNILIGLKSFVCATHILHCDYSGERNSGLSQLRDVILMNLADQLQKNRFGSEEDDHYM